jgi:hypothetical protein
MSAKNELQEIYQKQKIEIPVYTAYNLSNQPHLPEWQLKFKPLMVIIFGQKRFLKKSS